jgi:hypothetical protein
VVATGAVVVGIVDDAASGTVDPVEAVAPAGGADVVAESEAHAAIASTTTAKAVLEKRESTFPPSAIHHLTVGEFARLPTGDA